MIWDTTYIGLPWKVGGRDRKGLDCAGLAALWLREQAGIDVGAAGGQRPEGWQSSPYVEDGLKAAGITLEATWQPGDLVFFRHSRTGRIQHVAVALDGGKLLHIINGCRSRIDDGPTLLRRIGFDPAGAVPASQVGRLAGVLDHPELGSIFQAIFFIIGLALSFASVALAPKSKLGRFNNLKGLYSFDPQRTQSSSELPLPFYLGEVVTAGNSVFTSLADKTQTVTDSTLQKLTRVVVLSAGPIYDVAWLEYEIRINGLHYNNKYFQEESPLFGFQINPAQTKAEAVEGTFSGAAKKFPSISIYLGNHQLNVPVDIRAHYDRNFPVYGMAGCAYLVVRFIDSTKFQSGLNVATRVRGKICRQYDGSGFAVTTVGPESLSGADGVKTRFKLANHDIKAVTYVSVGGAGQTELTASTLAGTYHVNKTKGIIEFVTPPASGASITAEYTYYPRTWTNNPATLLVSLLTDKIQGRGFDESKIDWPAAVALYNHCNERVVWMTEDGPVTSPRYACSYAIDYRAPIQDHIRRVLDSCYGAIFFSNGKIVMKARKADSSVFSFTEASILAGSFETELIDRSDQANRIRVYYHAGDTYNTETGAQRDNPHDQRDRAARIGNDGIKEETLKVPAIDNLSQAERFGETVLREETNNRWVVRFKTNVQGLALEPLDIITVTHSSRPGWSAKLFRIEDLGYDEKDHLQIVAVEYFAGAYI